MNNNKGYSPKNCKWATKEEQERNKRGVSLHLYQGEMLTAGQIERRLHLPHQFLYNRMKKRGLSLEEAIERPPVLFGRNAPRSQSSQSAL